MPSSAPQTHLAPALPAAVSPGGVVAPVQLHADDAVVQGRPVQEGHGVQCALVGEVPARLVWCAGRGGREERAEAAAGTRQSPLRLAHRLERRFSPPFVSTLHSLDKAEAARLLGEAIETHDDALDGADLHVLTGQETVKPEV